MPKNPMDYSKTVIYKICCKDTNIKDVYIGHTTNFTKRQSQHKSNFCNPNCHEYDKLLYKCIRDNGEWENWSMIQLAKVDCNDRREAEAIEHQWIEKLSPSLNINKPYAMCKENPVEYKQEWYEEHKPAILEKAKHHYEEHKDEKLAYQKQYSHEHKVNIKDYQTEYREKNKDKLASDKKVYRENNKEMLALGQKEWREKNKEHLKEQRSQVVTCEDCGEQYTLINKIRHLKSKKHNEITENAVTENAVIESENVVIKSGQEIQSENDEKAAKLKAAQKAYREKNAEKIKEYKRIYNEANKDKIKEKCKEYYNANADKIKESVKQYQDEHKEQVNQCKLDWYHKNKDDILEKQCKKMTCECGSEFRKVDLSKHLKTKKHCDFIQNTIPVASV